MSRLAGYVVAAFVGAFIAWLSAITGASAAMREALIDRDNYRDVVRAELVDRGIARAPRDTDEARAGFHYAMTGHRVDRD